MASDSDADALRDGGELEAETRRICSGRVSSCGEGIGEEVGGKGESERLGGARLAGGLCEVDEAARGSGISPEAPLEWDRVRSPIAPETEYRVVMLDPTELNGTRILTHSNTTSSLAPPVDAPFTISSPEAAAATRCAAQPSVFLLAHFRTVQVYPTGRDDGTMGRAAPWSADMEDELDSEKPRLAGPVRPVTAPSGVTMVPDDRRCMIKGAVPNVA